MALVAAIAGVALLAGCAARSAPAPRLDQGEATSLACGSLAPAADATWRGRTMADFRPLYSGDQTYCATEDRSSISFVAAGDDAATGADLDHQLAQAQARGYGVPMVDASAGLSFVYGTPPQRQTELNGFGTSTVVPTSIPPSLFGVELIARRGSRYVRVALTSLGREALTVSAFDVPGAVQVAQALLAANWDFPGCSDAACRGPSPGS
jgi:hypothetical protein